MQVVALFTFASANVDLEPTMNSNAQSLKRTAAAHAHMRTA